MMSPLIEIDLIKKAIEARENAYCPYSNYAVGAALICGTNNHSKIYTGCNIENASYGATNCAERTALFKAISEGEKEFLAMAIVGGKKDEDIVDYALPCGICRQVLAEFCGPDFIIIVATKDDYKQFTLKELLPEAFSLVR